MNFRALWPTDLRIVFVEEISLAVTYRPSYMKVKSAWVPHFRFRKTSTQNAAEAYGTKAVMLTEGKPTKE